MKKLIALAIAALPAAAMADVTIYGEIGAAFENSSSRAGNAQRNTVNKVEDYNSKIGFKGTEDLGNGLKAIWQVEQALNIDNSAVTSSNNGFANRDSFVGLTSASFGTIQAGRLSSFINLESKLDPWKYSTGVNGLASKSIGGFNGIARYEDRFNNAIAYTSPEFAGFSARALYSAAGEQRTARGEGTSAYDLGLKYTNSGFYGLYSYTQSDNASLMGDAVNANTKSKAHHVQAGYDANNLLVAVEYLQAKTDPTNGNLAAVQLKTREAGLNVAYTIGAFQPRIQYVHGWKSDDATGSVAGTDYNQYILGTNYYLSKRTHAHVSAAWSKSGSDNTGARSFDDRTFAVGINHLF